jgi:biopolymer transport protein ExbD
MRTSGYNRVSRVRFDVQMTPMIDVVFQLLIFFVCTVSFKAQEESLPATPRLKATLGGSGAAEAPPPELEDLAEVEILVRRTAGAVEWVVNRETCATLADVRRRMTALSRIGEMKAKVPVILDVADDVPMAASIDVYDLCLSLGYEKVQFVTPEQE